MRCLSTTISSIIFFAGLAVLAEGAGKTPSATDLGYEALDKADYDGALARFNEAIQANAKNARAFQGRGLAHGGKGDLDSALADVIRAVELDPTEATAYQSRGTVYVARGEYDRAIADFGEAIRRNLKKDSTTYNNRGFAYLAKGEIERAISDFTEAIKLDPKAKRAYYNRGMAYAEIGSLDEAIQDFHRLVELDQKCDEYYLRLAQVYFTNGDFDKALAILNKAVRLFPNSADFCWFRGDILTLMGRFDQAIVDFVAAVRLDPRNPRIRVDRAECYAEQNKYDKAIADCDAAIALRPDEYCSYEKRGVLWLEQGEYDRGIADIQAAIRRNSADPASAFEAWAKAPVSEADLEHGKRQVRQMLKDRPIMAQYSERAHFLCEWASRKFAGEDAGRRIFWRDSKLSPNTLAANEPFPIDKRPGIMVSAKFGTGPNTGKDLCFEELWSNAVFELYNVTSANEFLRLTNLAYDKRLSKNEYVMCMIKCEESAADKTRAFYVHVFLPCARDNHLATDPGRWYVGCRSVPNEHLILATVTPKTPYWRHYAFEYDLIVLDSLTRKGEYQKAIDLAAALRGQAETPKDRAVISRCSGSCLLQLNKASLAVDAFSEAISLDPANYSSYMGRGQAYLALGKTDQAIADCSEAIRREPSDAALYFLRARVYETMGEKRRAKADLAAAAKITSDEKHSQQAPLRVCDQRSGPVVPPCHEHP